MGFKLVGERPLDQVGRTITAAGDVNGDETPEFLIAGPGFDTVEGGEGGEVYLVSGDVLGEADANDGSADGVIELGAIALFDGSFNVSGQDDLLIRTFRVSAFDDLDNDGKPEFVIVNPAFESFSEGDDSLSGGFIVVDGDDLAAADAADGTADGDILHYNFRGLPGSFGINTVNIFDNGEFSGRPRDITPIGDVTGDDLIDLFFSSQAGTFFVDGQDIPGIDTLDGAQDNIIRDLNVTQGPSSLNITGVGINAHDSADIDGDGTQEGLLGIGISGSGSLVAFEFTELAAVDAADGFVDSRALNTRIVEQPGAFQILGEDSLEDFGRNIANMGDMTGDGRDAVLVGARGVASFDPDLGIIVYDPAAAYLLDLASLAAADAADGAANGSVEVGNLVGRPGSYKFTGLISDSISVEVASAGDIDNDGQPDLLLGAFSEQNDQGERVGGAYLIDEDDLDAADLADGTRDGVIDVENIPAQPGSYRFVGEAEGDFAGRQVASFGDLDGNGLPEIAIAAESNGPQDVGAVYVMDPSELGVLDGLDGSVDGVIQLSNVATGAPVGPTPFDDILTGTAGPDEIDLLTGDDLYTALGGDDTVTASGGNDTVRGDAGDDVILGDGGDDVLGGGAGNDDLSGGDGDDQIAGSDGADTIDAGAGNDNIGGGTGADSIDGGAGNDVIGAGQGEDLADGGDGNDAMSGGPDNDTLIGGDGDDTIGASFGQDQVAGGAGDDSLGGGTGQDTLEGQDGNDAIGGGEGDDSVSGGAGDDFVAGGGRNDIVEGGAGDDRINGGDGDDTMTGGDGADVFVYNFFKDGDADVITDFEDGIDSFVMRGVDNAPGSGLAGKVAALGITDADAGAQINYLGHVVLIEGVAATDLTLADFAFL